MTDDELREAERAAYEIVKTDWETCCRNGAASALEIQRMCIKVYTAGRESIRAELYRSGRKVLEQTLDELQAERERSARLVESLKMIRDLNESECYARGTARVAIAEDEASRE